MYLLESNGSVRWTETSDDLLMKFVEEHGADLGQWDWREDTDRTLTPDLLQIAIRHGVACSLGIAVPVGPVLDVDRVADYREMRAKSMRSRPVREQQDQWTDQFVPGFAEHGRKLEDDVEESGKAHLDKIQKKADAVLSYPVNKELVAHWASLGGFGAL